MSPVVAEERIRLQHRLGLVICVSFAALEPVAAHEKPVPVISKGSLPEYMDEEIKEEMAHLENCHFDVHGVVVYLWLVYASTVRQVQPAYWAHKIFISDVKILQACIVYNIM